YALNAMLHFSFLHSEVTIVDVAAMNTAFRLVTVLLLAPFIGAIEKLTPIRLEERFVRYPALALEQSHLVINEMAMLVKESIDGAAALQESYSEDGYRAVSARCSTALCSTIC
ncbi:MAG: hypothetical protein II804_02265, partial [Clostridia bacterium]|nr:hypothetical protein [Clostridia bacterium]